MLASIITALLNAIRVSWVALNEFLLIAVIPEIIAAILVAHLWRFRFTLGVGRFDSCKEM